MNREHKIRFLYIEKFKLRPLIKKVDKLNKEKIRELKRTISKKPGKKA
jgi:hypothetical protein